ncbi:SOS response-associated peptidase [Leptospira levettii]|uniref:Abasic site processing protein n=1 Tax=Leptospira levettii TaxID=2023178 RepID=A0A5F2D7G6_9LEPT|nr:SOS response-associated peptidase [Leptospira levettii]MCW7465889.1 SOS response-associated peptidase [Leptospira levettii]MCW7474729.1 SOS response-associated peptidase [Leptospira levettii]MCW7510627.1 SOS response-associated peptidase [Leptospira levettii]MCW7514380.1 SOS response-associated peptidase [Leptospira levettii]TGK99610.1 SOS response-associated peptidase [Leptospira levettii]
MCGRFGYTIIKLKDGTEKWIRLIQGTQVFDIQKVEDTFRRSPNFEYYPSSIAPVIHSLSNHGENTLELMQWGVQPNWSSKPIFNTREERLFSTSFWSGAAKNNRCIIPATFFNEWKSEKGTKIKYKIYPKSGESFCFAGIWGEIPSPSPQKFWFSILTQEGNSLMKEVHNSGGNQGRQPVHLTEDCWENWLDPRIKEENQIRKLIQSYPSEFIIAEPEINEPMLF